MNVKKKNSNRILYVVKNPIFKVIQNLLAVKSIWIIHHLMAIIAAWMTFSSANITTASSRYIIFAFGAPSAALGHPTYICLTHCACHSIASIDFCDNRLKRITGFVIC